MLLIAIVCVVAGVVVGWFLKTDANQKKIQDVRVKAIEAVQKSLEQVK